MAVFDSEMEARQHPNGQWLNVGQERERERVEREGGGANEEEERVSHDLTCWFNIIDEKSISNNLMKQIV